MKLRTYRISLDSFERQTLFLKELNRKFLKDDPYWHYFLDETGVTLRVSDKIGKELDKLISGTKKSRKAGSDTVFMERHDDYEPEESEYNGIQFIGNDWIPFFHAISVITLKYPPRVVRHYILERACHSIYNHSGNFNFHDEAQTYAQLALDRAELGGKYGRGNKEK